MSFVFAPCSRVGKVGLYEASRVSGNRPPATRPSALDLKAMRRGIGAALKELYSDVLREEIPDRMVELLMQLDHQMDTRTVERP